MASRRQSDAPLRLDIEGASDALVKKFDNNEVASVFVVGLPYSGKGKLVDALKKKLVSFSRWQVAVVDAEEDCASTFRQLLAELEAGGIAVDRGRIKRELDFDPTPDSSAKSITYRTALARALANFSSKSRGEKLVLIMRMAEKMGSWLENEIFHHPPKNVVWVFISSCSAKITVSKTGGGAYAASLSGAERTLYLAPFHGLSVAGFCATEKIDEKQVWGELVDFLARVPTFEKGQGAPSNFLEALRMKIIGKKPIPHWVEEMLSKYGCFELFDNVTGRKQLALDDNDYNLQAHSDSVDEKRRVVVDIDRHCVEVPSSVGLGDSNCVNLDGVLLLITVLAFNGFGKSRSPKDWQSRIKKISEVFIRASANWNKELFAWCNVKCEDFQMSDKMRDIRNRLGKRLSESCNNTCHVVPVSAMGKNPLKQMQPANWDSFFRVSWICEGSKYEKFPFDKLPNELAELLGP